MSGVIEVEGKSEGVFHPKLGEIKTDALARRKMENFPPVAWFTTRIDIPNVLLDAKFFGVSKDTGERKQIDIGSGAANAVALNRVALGFRIADVPVVRWPDYDGYNTDEGKELNEVARELGDDPDDWYISETPVDVLKVAEFWHSPSIMKPKLQRLEAYLKDIPKLVEMGTAKGAYIPPSWLTPDQAKELARQLGVEVKNLPSAAASRST